MKQCEKCGMQLKDNAVFCGNCGTKVEEKVEVLPMPEKVPVPNAGESEGILSQLLQNNISSVMKLTKLLQESNNSGTQNSAEVAQLKQKLAEANQAVSDLNDQNELLNGIIEDLEEEKENMQKRITELEEEIAGKRCPKCGNEVTEDMRFCNVCGTQLKK